MLVRRREMSGRCIEIKACSEPKDRAHIWSWLLHLAPSLAEKAQKSAARPCFERAVCGQRRGLKRLRLFLNHTFHYVGRMSSACSLVPDYSAVDC